MKKSNLLLAISICTMLLISMKSNAQGFYINAGLGFGMNAASQSLGDSYTATQTFGGNGPGNVVGTFTNVKGSFGAGLNFGVGFGYMFTEHISGEIGLNFLSGTTIKITQNLTNAYIHSLETWNRYEKTELVIKMVREGATPEKISEALISFKTVSQPLIDASEVRWHIKRK